MKVWFDLTLTESFAVIGSSDCGVCCCPVVALNTALIVQWDIVFLSPLAIFVLLCLWRNVSQLEVKNAEMSESTACSASLGCLAVILLKTCCSVISALLPPDKNFEDDESVDGGRSSSSSKGASLSGRKTVSMGSFRRPASSKSAGQSRRVTDWAACCFCDADMKTKWWIWFSSLSFVLLNNFNETRRGVASAKSYLVW